MTLGMKHLEDDSFRDPKQDDFVPLLKWLVQEESESNVEKKV